MTPRRALRQVLRPLFAATVAAAIAAPAGDWQPAAPDHAWSFPRDHFVHRDQRIEWWYVTGHLTAVEDPAQEFGYQLTVFRVGLVPAAPAPSSAWSASHLLMGHMAVTDKRAGEHRFADLLYRETPLLAGFVESPGPAIAWSRAPAGSAGRWDLRWNGEAFDLEAVDRAAGIAFALVTRPAKPLVLQGPNGFSRKADEPGAASLYYSFTRLATEGTLERAGRTWKVRGESWMDHEFSTSHLGDRQVGWDWFAIQLADGRELMLYVMRRAGGDADHTSGTLVLPSGRARYLADGEWSVRVTARWRSPESGITYPAGWVVDLPSESLVLAIEPDVAGQENRSRHPAGLFYWEGAVTVRSRDGGRVGRGYVELTGYGDRRPPI